MYKLVFYVPVDYLETVKKAVFNSGAGRIGDYEHCCWQVRGSGQFRPMVGSKPFVGKVNELEVVEEFRVEMVCEDELIRNALQAMLSAHPYEEPAYDVWQLADVKP